MSGLKLQRIGQIMEPEPGNPMEVEGVLNPAAVRGPDGELYLFPRLVAKGNYSRIGIAKVLFNDAGDPVGVERLGIALEPEADYEFRAEGSGGCEDPRVTFVEPLKRYLMTYTAHSAIGPRIAIAVSEDLFHWKRLGLVTFESFMGIDFAHVNNKDASFFPIAIPNHAGKMQLGIIHRPLFPDTLPEETACEAACREVDIEHESIWISYCPMGLDSPEPHRFGLFNSHHRLATPVSPWERLKIGGGTPPILTRHGWLIVYHGVNEVSEPGSKKLHLQYSAGVMVLSKEHPREILYRSVEPVLTPLLPEERNGIVPNVVFPTGIDRRDDLGLPDRFDVYYGMADNRIGVARLDLLDILPAEGVADPPEAKGVMRRDVQVKGHEAMEQISILGDDNVPLDYHEKFWKSELIDFVILQQDAFDSVDGFTSIERLKYMQQKISEICETSFNFSAYEEVGVYFRAIINAWKQINYSQFQSEEFKNFNTQLDEILNQRKQANANGTV